jgi:hypothetical protein
LLLQDVILWLRFSEGVDKSDFVTHKKKLHVEF